MEGVCLQSLTAARNTGRGAAVELGSVWIGGACGRGQLVVGWGGQCTRARMAAGLGRSVSEAAEEQLPGGQKPLPVGPPRACLEPSHSGPPGLGRSSLLRPRPGQYSWQCAGEAGARSGAREWILVGNSCQLTDGDEPWGLRQHLADSSTASGGRMECADEGWRPPRLDTVSAHCAPVYLL